MKLLVEFYYDGFNPAVLEGHKYTFEKNILNAEGTLEELSELLRIINENTEGDRFVHLW